MTSADVAHRAPRAGSNGRAFRAFVPAVVGGALLLFASAACSDITDLDQEAPGRVLGSALYVPANAQLLVTSAISDFECALTNYIVAAGLVGDELIDAELAQVGWDYDRRTIVPSLTTYAVTTCGNTQVPALYTPISIARYQADLITKALEGWTDAEVAGRQDLLAQATAHAGYSMLLIAEGMCTAALDGGPELTRIQLFTEAEARFTKAITAATAANNTAMLNMARVGRARARLNLDKLPEARADAALVPNGFVRNANYSAANFRRENLVNTQLYRGLFSSVDPSFRGVTFGGVADPRVSVVDAGILGSDRATPLWRATKYPTSASPIPIARYEEAQLIVAEADLAAGNVQSAVNIINALHTKAGIPAYGGGTAAEVKVQLIEERRRELFLEGQRLNDMIRFKVPLSPVAGTAYPSKGGVYGSQLCFPLPDVERNNNPTLSGEKKP